MKELFDIDCNPKTLSPLTLAFIGDGVYELYVREFLVRSANRPVDALHKESVQYVNAGFQAKMSDKLLPTFTQEEETMFKRGRNAQTGSRPKNASGRDYSYATGLETLIGFLYLDGQRKRIAEIMGYILTHANFK